jgi:uncharacterized membrane protein YraQ (UPF0718 family)
LPQALINTLEAKSRRKQNFSKKMPIAAALILKGLTPGAALVFLMTGPATNAASFVTIWKILGRATALTYLATIAGCAILERAGQIIFLAVIRLLSTPA